MLYSHGGLCLGAPLLFMPWKAFNVRESTLGGLVELDTVAACSGENSLGLAP